MAIKFTVKHDAKGSVAALPSPTGSAAAAGAETPERKASVGASIETVASPAIDAGLFEAAPARSRKRRKK
jgi:hypothetical protein